MPRLHQVRRGSGEPLLLIMGMAGHHQMWGEPFLTLLEKDFDTLTFDHRGIGDSDRADTSFTIADLADDAAHVLESAGMPSAHVFGISLGGMVAQELTLRRPELVRTLTLGCTYPGTGGDLSATGVQRAVEASATRDAELAARTAFEVNHSPRYTADQANYDQFRAAALAVKVPVPVMMLQMQAVLGHDAIPRLGEINVPTLIIHGTADEILSVSNAHQLAGLIPGARLELFDDAGHLFWWEDPERTVALLRDHTAQT